VIPSSVEISPLKMDDPKRPEFSSWRSYTNFATSVLRKRRYIWDPEVRAFLDTLLATVRDRDRILPEGTLLYRAQHGVNHKEDDDQLVILAHKADRMTPQRGRAMEGRANSKGIPVLYLATSLQTAISEVRPWIGSEVSVAQFKISRELKAIDLSVGHGESVLEHLTIANLLGEDAPDPELKEKVVWIDVDNAFSRPTSVSDDFADYVPTQILAELFCNNGYDALIYRSQFGQEGFNIALFDIKDAEIIGAAPYQVTAVDVEYKEMGNPWGLTNHNKTTSPENVKSANQDFN